MTPHDRRRRQLAILNLVFDWPEKHFGEKPSPLTLEHLALQVMMTDADPFLPEARAEGFTFDELINRAMSTIGALLRDLGRLNEVVL